MCQMLDEIVELRRDELAVVAAAAEGVKNGGQESREV